MCFLYINLFYFTTIVWGNNFLCYLHFTETDIKETQKNFALVHRGGGVGIQTAWLPDQASNPSLPWSLCSPECTTLVLKGWQQGVNWTESSRKTIEAFGYKFYSKSWSTKGKIQSTEKTNMKLMEMTF